MKFKHTNVLPAEPNLQCGIVMSWNLGIRAVVASSRMLDLIPDGDSGLYQTIFDFRHPPDTEKHPLLAQEWDVRPCDKGGYTMALPPGDIIVLGLGLRIDFGELHWVLGSISLRRQWLLRGLMVINSNNPIYGGSGEEVVAFLKNNALTPALLTWHERPFQIHFQQILGSPQVELC